jgi:hypothetical protein
MDIIATLVEAVAKLRTQFNEQKALGYIKGDKGEQGYKGEDGKDGVDGKDGIDGKDGKDGVDGVSSTIRTERVTGGYNMYITVGTQTTMIFIADGKDDPWITGTIGADKQNAKNAGNYGVMYNTNIKWKSTDGKGLALITWNSRSADNQWCGGMGLTMELFDANQHKTIAQFPSDRLITKAAPEAILLRIYKPDPTKEIQEINFTYSPPGASCLPTPLVLVPIDLK